MTRARRGASRATVKDIDREEAIARWRRRAFVAGAIVLIVSGIAAAYTYIPKPPPNIHWHVKYKIVTDGRQAATENLAFTGMGYPAAHMHSDAYDKIHNEGRQGSANLVKFFKYTLKGDLSDSRMVLPPGSTAPGTYTASAEKPLMLWVNNSRLNETWHVVPSIEAYTFTNADRLILQYGPVDDVRMRNFQEDYAPFDGTG